MTSIKAKERMERRVIKESRKKERRKQLFPHLLLSLILSIAACFSIPTYHITSVRALLIFIFLSVAAGFFAYVQIRKPGVVAKVSGIGALGASIAVLVSTLDLIF